MATSLGKGSKSTGTCALHFLSRSPHAALATFVSTGELILFLCRAFPNVFVAASPLGRANTGVRERGFHQITMIGLRRLELRLDYALGMAISG